MEESETNVLMADCSIASIDDGEVADDVVWFFLGIADDEFDSQNDNDSEENVGDNDDGREVLIDEVGVAAAPVTVLVGVTGGAIGAAPLAIGVVVPVVVDVLVWRVESSQFLTVEGNPFDSDVAYIVSVVVGVTGFGKSDDCPGLGTARGTSSVILAAVENERTWEGGSSCGNILHPFW